LLDPEDEGPVLRNVGNYSSEDKAPHHKMRGARSEQFNVGSNNVNPSRLSDFGKKNIRPEEQREDTPEL
jgi:hypothetical protein